MQRFRSVYDGHDEPVPKQRLWHGRQVHGELHPILVLYGNLLRLDRRVHQNTRQRRQMFLGRTMHLRKLRGWSLLRRQVRRNLRIMLDRHVQLYLDPAHVLYRHGQVRRLL